MTPAEKRFKRITAAALGSNSQAESVQATNLQEQMLMLLAEHRRALKGIQSLERKLQAKEKMLPEYQPYIAGVLDSNSGRQDEVLVTVMLWHIDIGDITAALLLAGYALKHNLVMPDRFERGLACTIAEEIAETANRLLETETPVAAELLSQTVALTRDFDMYDEARAKLYKQLGLAQQAEKMPVDALASFEKALQLHERCGVKKLIEQLQREQKKNDSQDKSDTATSDKQSDNQDKPDAATSDVKDDSQSTKQPAKDKTSKAS